HPMMCSVSFCYASYRFFFSSRRRHTRSKRDWSSDVCSSDLRRKNRGDLMFRTISNFMRVADIRNKIVFTLLMLVIFRIGTFIPVPFTNKDAIDFMGQENVFGFLNTFGGGALQNFSI